MYKKWAFVAHDGTVLLYLQYICEIVPLDKAEQSNLKEPFKDSELKQKVETIPSLV